MEEKNNLTLTVGIPTYYGGPALVRAVASIKRSKGLPPFRFIVCVDGNPLQPDIEQQLAGLGAEVVMSPIRGGQVARIKQLVSLASTDLLVLTQDDIVFTPTALSAIVAGFVEHPEITMIGAWVEASAAETFFESVIAVGVRAAHAIGRLWRNGDNYLLSSGRCLGFRTASIKRFTIPEEVINSDAYLYFENQRQGGKFLALPEAVVYNKGPQRLAEHLKQSRKFQRSHDELRRYFDARELKAAYAVPVSLQARAYLGEFLHRPLQTVCYTAVYLYTSFVGRGMYAQAKRFWETDVSTKR